jgi:hypothetical protein
MNAEVLYNVVDYLKTGKARTAVNLKELKEAGFDIGA